MSNRATLEPTTFISRDGSKTFGYRFYDDYAGTYCNFLEESCLKLDVKEFLNLVVDGFDETGAAIFDAVLDKGGFYFGNDWTEIQRTDTGWEIISE